MPGVFLAHSSRDKWFVRWLASKFEDYGIRYWLDEAELRVGDSLIGRIGEAIDECDFCAVVLSPSSVESEWVQRELHIALNKEFLSREVVVLPLLLEKVEIPPFLRDKVRADFSADEKREESLALLLKTLGVGPTALSSSRDLPIRVGPVRQSVEAEPQGELDEWITESRTRWGSLLEERLPQEKPSRFAHGTWQVGYLLSRVPRVPSGKELLDVLDRVSGRETGWPPWSIPRVDEFLPYKYYNAIECWLATPKGAGPAYSDFWRASLEGKMFLCRGYQDDERPEEREPGTVFDLILPIWRIGECLLHGERLANALGEPSAEVLFRVEWTGLAGRTLVSCANSNRRLFQTYQCRQPTVDSLISVPADNISAELPAIVESLTSELYEAFNLVPPYTQMIREELSQMTGRKYE